MSKSESKRQKRLAKQKAKRNEKHQVLNRAKSMGLAERLAGYEAAPVVDCLINTAFEENGMASLLISRRAESGEVAFFVFLVDTYCLGVKDCFGKITTPAEYRKQLERFRKQGVRSLDPPSARRLIEDAVAYADSFGLPPHPDFRKMRPILNGINPEQAREIFPMGKDGKPLYIPGPGQSAAESRRIMTILESHVGRGAYHFKFPIPTADGLDLDDRIKAIGPDEYDDDE